ncbi:hypothetical protein MMC18_009043 [Xylographa bjoerkii]|nr:hypothetical protein [Xylographa bjoerkii]
MAAAANTTLSTDTSQEEDREAEKQDAFKADAEVISAPATEKPQAAGPPSGVKPEYPEGLALSIVVVALMLSMFLVALDMSIIATAIPKITADFQSLDQVGWYGSAFFLTLAAFVSFWGKAYKHLPIKWSFLTAILVFELGSLICAVSPNSTALIVGRAIQGAGGAGVTGGVYTIIAYVVPPPKVAAYMGLVGAVFSLASVAGPLVGGAFTQNVTWRWCFYINLPVGGATLVTLLFCFHTPPHARPVKISLKELFLTFDIPGIGILICSLVCFFLALEWGGITYAWNSSKVVGCLVGWIAIAILFVVVEWKQGERAIIVPRILKKRTIAVGSAFIFCTNVAGFARVYNLPIYFQAIDGVSPSESGIRVLPTILAISLFTFVGAGAVGKIGWYQPFLIFGSMLATIGGSLIYTFDIGTSIGKFIGYQVIAGAGIGIAIQVPVIVAQATSSRPDMAVSMSTVLFFQFLAGSIGVGAAQNIFDNRLIASLPTYAPTVSVADVLNVGAYDLPGAFPDPIELLGVLQSYMQGLKAAWIFSIVLSACTFLISFTAPWKSIKPKPSPPAAAAATTTGAAV